MLKTVLEQNVFMYIIAAVGLIGIVARIILCGCLGGLVRATENMGTTRKKSLAEIRKRYEDITSLNVEVKDTNSFVGKYIEKLKIGKISVKAWNNFIKNMLVLIAGTGIIGSLYQYYITGSPYDSMEILMFGTGTYCVLMMAGNLFDCPAKIRMLDFGIQNYLENSLANRLHKEELKLAAVTEIKVPETASIEAKGTGGNVREKKKDKKPERQKCRSQDEEEALIAESQTAACDELLKELLEGIIS